MNINILMIALGVTVLGSCSTAYKGGQTPDDLYYSAPKEVIVTGDEEYLSVNNREERYSPNRREYDNPEQYETFRNDRWMRMSIGSPYYMNTFNNYYWNDWGYSGMYGGGFNHGYNNFYGGWGLGGGWGMSAGFGGFNSWNNPWGNSIYWNSFYNPYAFNYNPYGFNHIGIGPNIKPPIYRSTARPAVFNRGAYSNGSGRSNVNTTTRNYYNPRTGTYSNYSNSNNGNRTMSNGSNNTRRNNSDAGTYYNTNNSSRRDTYTPSSNSSSDGRPQRSYTPSPSPSSNNSGGSTGNSGGGGGGGVRRPTRN